MAPTQAEMERLGHLNQMDFFESMALGTPGGRTADTGDDELAYALPHGFAMMRSHERADADELLGPEPSGAEIREVGDVEAAADYWAVWAGAYPSLGFPADLFEIFTPEWLVDERIRAFVAYMDGAPVSCALTWTSRGVAGICWVATLEAARGRGLGAACSVAATNAGFEHGAGFAALQASPMGEPVYQRLGYRELYPYRVQFARIGA